MRCTNIKSPLSAVLKLKRCLLFFMLLLLMDTSAPAQFYSSGASKAGTKWNYIESSRYKLIYPVEIDSLARRYFNLLETYGQLNEASMKSPGIKFPVVLYPYTTQSNGMVSYAPRIMELYTRPTPDSYSQKWEEHLVLHETRHVAQIAHFTGGAFRPLSWLFGEQITGLALGVYSTRWEMEGDAVLAETEFSEAGRGREASFLEYYRMALLSGGNRTRVRWRYGSNKYYTPDVYAYGYMTYSAGRLLAGEDFSADVFSTLSRKMYSPAVVKKAYNKGAGMTHKRLFETSLDLYGSFWREDFAKRGKFTEYTALSHGKSGYYTEYRSPVRVGKDSVICIKYSYDKPSELVLLSGGKERRLRPFSSSASELAFIDGNLYYTETVPDTRWEKGSVERLFAYNLSSGRIRPLSGKESYYNPAANPENGKLAVIEYPVSGGSNIHILDPEDDYASGLVIPAPDGGQLTFAAWCGKTLHAVAITEEGAALFRLDTAADGDSGYVWLKEFDAQRAKIASLKGHNGVLYFMSDVDGVNNIYSYDPYAGKLGRITNSEYGAESPSLSDSLICYVNLSGNSKDAVSIPLENCSSGHSVNLENGILCSSFAYSPADSLSSLPIHAKSERDGDGLPEGTYREGRYRKGLHLFNFHSWAPFYYNVDRIKNLNYDYTYQILSLGATAYSQNAMGTAVTMIGYSYHDGFHAGHASFEYSGLLPVFKVSADYNAEQRYTYSVLSTADGNLFVSEASSVPLFELDVMAYVPLKFNGRGWLRSLIPQLSWNYENTSMYSLERGKSIHRQKLVYGVRYAQVRPVATGALYSRSGFGLSVMGSVPVESSEYFGGVLSLSGTLYLPGFVPTHGVMVSAGYQRQFTEGKHFYSDNLLAMPRGYDHSYYGDEYYKISVDYAIPVNLRGLDLGFFAYVKQLQIIPFADFAGVKSPYGERRLDSYGCDFAVNAHFFRMGTPMTIGIRNAYNRAEKRLCVALLFNVELW